MAELCELVYDNVLADSLLPIIADLTGDFKSITKTLLLEGASTDVILPKEHSPCMPSEEISVLLRRGCNLILYFSELKFSKGAIPNLNLYVNADLDLSAFEVRVVFALDDLIDSGLVVSGFKDFVLEFCEFANDLRIKHHTGEVVAGLESVLSEENRFFTNTTLGPITDLKI